MLTGLPITILVYIWMLKSVHLLIWCVYLLALSYIAGIKSSTIQYKILKDYY